MDAAKSIKMVYTNYRGETAIRTILPNSIWFGSCQWYPDEQWLLSAYDMDRTADRTFALKNIRAWLGTGK